MKLFIRKRVVTTLFLAVFSFSCSHPCHQWRQETLVACTPPEPVTRIYSTPCSPFNGISTEFVLAGAQQDLYLNVLTLQFPVTTEDHHQTPITVIADEQEYHYVGERMEGGQRVHLPDEALQLISIALLEQKPVTITSGRYRETLDPDNFALLYTARD